MSIEQYFYNEKANAVFNPVPAYDGEWFFSCHNLEINSQNNLFTEFLTNTYQNPLLKIFKTDKILKLKPIFKSAPDKSMYGRTLKYSKEDFFKGVISFLNQKIDIMDNQNDYEKSLNKIYNDNIRLENSTLNLVFANIFKERSMRLKDVLDTEFDSRFFDYVYADYENYKNKIEFKDYVKENYEFSLNMYQGILALGDFFDNNLDFNELYNCFEKDKFYLLFAKIIYEYNVEYLKTNQDINNSCKYLYFYKSMLDLIKNDDKNYNIQIKYNNMDYDIRSFLSDYQKIVTKIPLRKIIILPNLDKKERIKYANINLMKKWENLFADEVLMNWDFLYQGETIPRTSQNVNINLRIGVLENSGYMGMPMKGHNIFENYYAFVYSNGEVIIEYIKDDILLPTYVIKIDNFIDLCKQNTQDISKFTRNIDVNAMRRIFHTSFNNWQRILFKEISDEEINLDKVISDVERIKRGVMNNETDL